MIEGGKENNRKTSNKNREYPRQRKQTRIDRREEKDWDAIKIKTTEAQKPWQSEVLFCLPITVSSVKDSTFLVFRGYKYL